MTFFKGTFFARLAVWRIALEDHTPWTVLVGHGVHGWTDRISRAPILFAVPGREAWPLACNEPLEWFYAFGLVGTAPVAWGLWCLRRRFMDARWGGVLTALAVMSLSFPALHYAPLVVVGAIALTLAGRP